MCNEGYTGLTCAISAEGELEAPLTSDEEESYDGTQIHTTEKIEDLQDLDEPSEHTATDSSEKLNEEHIEMPHIDHDDMTHDGQRVNDPGTSFLILFISMVCSTIYSLYKKKNFFFYSYVHLEVMKNQRFAKVITPEK